MHQIQAGFKITPLSRWGKAPEPVAVKIDPNVDMKTPPKIQVDRMPAAKYFAYAAELMKLHRRTSRISRSSRSCSGSASSPARASTSARPVRPQAGARERAGAAQK